MSTNHVSVPVAVGSNYLGPAPPEPCSDSDSSDHDHPGEEPEFVMHAMDDRRRRAVRLPILQLPPLPANWERQAAARARTERLQYYMLAPQVVNCVWILVFGSMMIFLAVNPHRFPDQNFTWLIVFSALIMLLTLLSLLLSHLGINVYDN